jgi:hypothetical protein
MEEINTQDKMPAGTAPMLQYNREVTTIGIAYFPHPQVAFKLDYEDWEDEDNTTATGEFEQFNLGLAYMF